MKLSKERVSTIIGITLVFVGVFVGDNYLPNDYRIGSLLMGLLFFFLPSVFELNYKNVGLMLKYLYKNILFTSMFIIVEIWLGNSIRTLNEPLGQIEAYILFFVWVISGLYRTVLEVTPVIFKLEPWKAIQFYNTFSRTRTLYYFLLVVMFFRGGMLSGYTVLNMLNILLFLVPFFFFTFIISFYIPFFPSEINWIVTSWINQGKLKLNLNILRFIYKNKSASFEELQANTNEDANKLKTALEYMMQQHFIKFNRNRYEFHPIYIIKQNIRFF